MKIKMKKILLTILILVIALSTISTVFAVSSTDIKGKFSGSANLDGKSELTNIIAGTLDAVRIATAAIAIIMLSILAVKYMISSPNDRAEIKKGATVYIIGAIVMMSASTLVTFIKDFTVTNIKTSQSSQ